MENPLRCVFKQKQFVIKTYFVMRKRIIQRKSNFSYKVIYTIPNWFLASIVQKKRVGNNAYSFLEKIYCRVFINSNRNRQYGIIHLWVDGLAVLLDYFGKYSSHLNSHWILITGFTRLPKTHSHLSIWERFVIVGMF